MLLKNRKETLDEKIEAFEDFLILYNTLREKLKVKEVAELLDVLPNVLSQYTQGKLAISTKRVKKYISIMQKYEKKAS